MMKLLKVILKKLSKLIPPRQEKRVEAKETKIAMMMKTPTTRLLRRIKKMNIRISRSSIELIK